MGKCDRWLRPAGMLWLVAAAAGAQTGAPAPEEDSGALRGDPIRLPVTCEATAWEAAGLVCNSRQPCYFRLDLFDVGRLGDALVVAGEVYSADGSLRSAALVSRDEGESWLPVGEPIPGGAVEQGQFLDSKHGWLGGQQTLPTGQLRVFILSTEDGGETWRRYDVRPDAEDGGDTLVEFCFDSAQHGQLVLDRGTRNTDSFEQYDSMTGGRSWNLRSRTRTAPALGGCSGRTKDWRLRRAEGDGVWYVERREGENWTATSSFAIELAACP